jgi:hypothetical protein
MRRRHYKRRKTRIEDSWDDLVAQLFATIVGITIFSLGGLYVFDRGQFWSVVDHWVLPAVAVFVTVLIIAMIVMRARHKREEARFAEILTQITQKQLVQEVHNFIDGFGSDGDGDDPWVSASESYTFDRTQLRRLRDLLARQGVALSTRSDDDMTAVLEHFINDKEERFLTERITARVTHRFSEFNKTGEEFERLVARLYEGMGYAAKRVGRVGDQGGDVIASKGGENVLIQAKFYGGSVGNAAVQQATAARQYYSCTRAAVVTTSSFTREAIALARSNDVDLVDGIRLKQLLAEHLQEAWQ